MRDIKFRTWNLSQKRWEEKLCLYLDDSKLGDVSECFHNEEDAKNYVLEQFTGIKDRSGKEIYEGDVIRIIKDSMWKHDGIYSVGYDRGSFNLTHKTLTMGMRTLIDLDFELIEVIGNIHENPELIK